jgi:hypothetical protein
MRDLQDNFQLGLAQKARQAEEDILLKKDI